MMKSARFVHVAGVLSIAALSVVLMAFLMGARPSAGSLSVAAFIASPAFFYGVWLYYRRFQQRESYIMLAGLWLSFILCSLSASIVGYLYGPADIDQPTLTTMDVIVKYSLLSCLPISFILLTLYIISEIRQKRRK